MLGRQLAETLIFNPQDDYWRTALDANIHTPFYVELVQVWRILDFLRDGHIFTTHS